MSNPVLAELRGGDPYDDLPESIKMLYTPQQFVWLGDAEKARVVERECEPEWGE